ncbi:GNAT family N-acetyltransferase, partial [Streptomyces tricolor]
MSGTEIRDDRVAGRLEAVGDGEAAGRRIEYVVLESPARPGRPRADRRGRPGGEGSAGALARGL